MTQTHRDAPTLRVRLLDGLGALRHDIVTNAGAPTAFDWRTFWVLILCSVLSTLFYYYARPNFYHNHLDKMVEAALGMTGHPLRSVLPYWYWAVASLVIRVLIPLGCIVFWFRESPRDYGFRLWERGHGKLYLGLYLVMAPLLVAASYTKSFQEKYPFYDDAQKSIAHFLSYEIAYGIQFASLEAFFRGFMIFALFKRFGYQGVVIMTIPYCMIHFSKPVSETLGAVVAGLVLGYMAIQSRSWLPGALLHWSIGFTMDLLCLWHEGFFKHLGD
jgi:membrane protease YdiL (CAAX protease family)